MGKGSRVVVGVGSKGKGRAAKGMGSAVWVGVMRSGMGRVK